MGICLTNFRVKTWCIRWDLQSELSRMGLVWTRTLLLFHDYCSIVWHAWDGSLCIYHQSR